MMELKSSPIFSKSCPKSCCISLIFFKNGPIPASFSFIFGLFKQTLQFYNKYMWKNVHPVYGAGIRTHNIWKVSLLP